jgi:hypothetical protein
MLLAQSLAQSMLEICHNVTPLSADKAADPEPYRRLINFFIIS